MSKLKTASLMLLIFGVFFLLPVLAQDDTAGRVKVNNLANLEALVNIQANFAEILGMVYAGNFLLGAAAVFIRKRWIMGVVMLLLIPTFLVIGLGTPPTYNAIIESMDETGLFIVMIIGLVQMLVFTAMIFFPTIIALTRNHHKKWLIFGLNFLAGVPFGWPVLMYFAYAEPPAEQPGNVAF